MPLTSGTIKFISSLRQKKVRQTYHKFTAEGGRIVGELLRQRRYRIDHVYALPGWLDAHADVLPEEDRYTAITEKELGRISQLKTANQVLAVVDMLAAPTSPPAPAPNWPDLNAGWSLYLDGVQSPANLGALLRIADWFGFRNVIGGPGTADLYNSKTVQASMGSFLRVNYLPGTIDELTKQFPNLEIFGADLSGENVYQLHPPSAGLLVVGAEGPGVSEGARAQVQRWVHIPRVVESKTESLNVAVATGILCGQLRFAGQP